MLSRPPRWLPVLSLLALLMSGNPLPAAPRLNVVVILADDLGWADLGCQGSKFFRTPALDRLATSGIRFTDGYASCPVCSPTRAALLTGKVPSRVGITDWLPGRPDSPQHPLLRPPLKQQLALEETTLAELFKSAGYATAHIGKWHLGGDGFGPTQQGFDLNIAGDATGTPRSYFAPFRNKGGVMPGLEKAEPNEYLTDRLTTEAVRFIEAQREKPFFLYLAHNAVHTPLRAKPDLLKKYPGKLTLGQQSNPIYAAMLESLDEGVGKVVSTLERLGLRERTLVIFTSDNGGLATREGPDTPATINSPLREGKGWLYEGGIRVPFLISWPGVVKPGTVSSVPVITHDLFPTLVEACGLTSHGPLDGVSLVPLLRGKAAPAREALYWHYPHYANQGSRPSGAIRTGRYKMIEFYGEQRRELFDLQASVGEGRNLAQEKPLVVKELAERLARWRKEVGAVMPTPNPDYLPHPPNARGAIVLPAQTAFVRGSQLRYEPLPHKNTLGFWIDVNDSAYWELTVRRPGKYRVEVLQGCGTGQGGSEVEVKVGKESLRFIVEDTGHFQNFKPRDIGTVQIASAGRHTLTIQPLKKARAAVMDVRQVTLTPVEK
ncbi:MAG: sulfatase-like hydrolase/transferase [Gemmataceae bacterium]